MDISYVLVGRNILSTCCNPSSNHLVRRSLERLGRKQITKLVTKLYVEQPKLTNSVHKQSKQKQGGRGQLYNF